MRGFKDVFVFEEGGRSLRKEQKIKRQSGRTTKKIGQTLADIDIDGDNDGDGGDDDSGDCTRSQTNFRFDNKLKMDRAFFA